MELRTADPSLMAALGRTRLDAMQCSDPHCNEKHEALYFHGRCHPRSPTWTRYEDGTVTVLCAECDATIAEIAVADV